MSDGATQSLGGDGDPTRLPEPIAGTPPRAPTPHLPSRIGRYIIVRVLGEGGMGTVYEAQQESPKRAVALKVIRAGHVSPDLLRRFEHESAVLGRLQHPGIAQVYEAGTVQDERGYPVPFFAMEFIRGVPLTDYASSKRLGTRERLDLIARVCDAVDHAHQKGVIHRDLKPGNILVDESGQPKVLDFGVARATDSDIQQTTLQTDVGQLIGTVPYMSPEQVSGNPMELDTRSDVYALGVIAYELLAGRLPYDLGRRAIHEAVRVIREEEPNRLSSINRTLRGDVETIVAKALEKEKARRYQSAEGLASDIRRYLKDEPITARPASTWYQVSKFSRRNKGLVAGLAAAFVFLSAGLVLALISRADAVSARNAEKTRADELKKVSDFQEKMLGQVNPTAAGIRLTEDVNRRFAAALEKANVPEAERPALADDFHSQWARVNATDAAAALIDETILKPAVKAIDEQFKDQPIVDAQLRQALAECYRNLGLYDAAHLLLKNALETRRRVLGEEHPDTLSSIHGLGSLLQVMVKVADAEPYCREAMEKRRRVLGEEHPDTISSIVKMGYALWAQSKLDQAEPLIREAMEKSRRVLGTEHPDTRASLTAMGALLQEQGKLAEAEPYYREVLERSRTASSMTNMGVQLHTQGKLAEAERHFREALERTRREEGEEHPITLRAMENLGRTLMDQGKLAEAEPYCREVLEKRRRVPGEWHTDTLWSIEHVGRVLEAQGKLTEAEPYAREVLEKSRRVRGEEHLDTLRSLNHLGFLLQAQGNLTEAESCYREALEKRRRLQGEEDPGTLVTVIHLGALFCEMGKPAEAIELLTASKAAARKALAGPDARRIALMLTTLGRARLALGYDPDRFALAEANLLEAHPIYIKARGENHKDTLGCVQSLIDLYAAWDRAEPGKGYDGKTAEWQARLDSAPPTPPDKK